jgi:hypothetical protein
LSRVTARTVCGGLGTQNGHLGVEIEVSALLLLYPKIEISVYEDQTDPDVRARVLTIPY